MGRAGTSSRLVVNANRIALPRLRSVKRKLRQRTEVCLFRPSSLRVVCVVPIMQLQVPRYWMSGGRRIMQSRSVRPIRHPSLCPTDRVDIRSWHPPESLPKIPRLRPQGCFHRSAMHSKCVCSLFLPTDCPVNCFGFRILKKRKYTCKSYSVVRTEAHVKPNCPDKRMNL